MDMQAVVSKGEFAALCGVTPGRVSQWIAEGKIGASEMEGEGRAARIRVFPATQKLKIRLDAGQRIGNGIATKLPDSPAAPESKADEIDLNLKRAKLLTAEAQNRKLAEEERARRGIYVRTERASAEAGKLAGTVLQMFEGGLSDVASEIAAEYKLPQRDVMHLMRKRFREVRAKISAKLVADATALPLTIDDDGAD